VEIEGLNFLTMMSRTSKIDSSSTALEDHRPTMVSLRKTLMGVKNEGNALWWTCGDDKGHPQ
jgi:hypothetical protein